MTLPCMQCVVISQIRSCQSGLSNIESLRDRIGHLADKIERRGLGSLALPEVVVSRKCGEAVMRGADVYVPGVTGAAPHLTEGDRVCVLVDVYDRIFHSHFWQQLGH